jgi:hypothetical protein
MAVMAGLGVAMDDTQARHMLEAIRAFVAHAKRPPSDEELHDCWQTLAPI